MSGGARARPEHFDASGSLLSRGVVPAESDISDFAHLQTAEVGQARFWMKAGHPVTPARSEILMVYASEVQWLLDRPLSAGDDGAEN